MSANKEIEKIAEYANTINVTRSLTDESVPALTDRAWAPEELQQELAYAILAMHFLYERLTGGTCASSEFLEMMGPKVDGIHMRLALDTLAKKHNQAGMIN